MINFIEENSQLNYGFNFYKLSDRHSIGFKLKYCHNGSIMARFSKITKKFRIKNIVAGRVMK